MASLVLGPGALSPLEEEDEMRTSFHVSEARALRRDSMKALLGWLGSCSGLSFSSSGADDV